jgi:hypothetical protein
VVFDREAIRSPSNATAEIGSIVDAAAASQIFSGGLFWAPFEVNAGKGPPISRFKLRYGVGNWNSSLAIRIDHNSNSKFQYSLDNGATWLPQTPASIPAVSNVYGITRRQGIR